MKFELDNESMKYKQIIAKGKHNMVSSITKEYIIFNVIQEDIKPIQVKVSFLFDWTYDKEDGFSYTKVCDFSGHKRYNEEDRQWLENYCNKHYPDLHHMSY